MEKNMDEPHATREKRPVLLKNGNPQGNPSNAPKCGAKTRKGTPCRAPAMKNSKCRLHGGKSTGPRTPEGLERSRKGNWKHGYYSAESIARSRYISQFLRESRILTKEIISGNILNTPIGPPNKFDFGAKKGLSACFLKTEHPQGSRG